MHQYFIKTPWLVKQIFSSYVWNVETEEKVVYLTFDDGPHPEITPWVMAELKKYGAVGTFFCIGDNVNRYPEIYKSLQREGHAVGNHTYHHVNGWQVSTEEYIREVERAATLIRSHLFRPPYGRIRGKQAKRIPAALGQPGAKVIMWDVLSADFDPNFSPQQCLDNVLGNYTKGSIIVFHDSEKAFPNLEYILPKILAHVQEAGYGFRRLE